MSNTALDRAGLRWQLEWRISLFALVFVPLFLSLGVWQLQRADEKRAISAQWESQRREAAVPLESLSGTPDELAYRPVTLRGQALTGRNFALDNRIRDGRYGVEVITPMRLDSGGLVLVNRGWQEADPMRRSLPEVSEIVGGAMVTGYIYVPPGESFLLGEIASDGVWPRLIQAAHVPSLAEMLGENVYPFIVRLTPDSAGALLADWPLLNTRPEKHNAYAVQWFAMAAVLLLLFVWRSSNLGEWLRNRRPDQEKH